MKHMENLEDIIIRAKEAGISVRIDVFNDEKKSGIAIAIDEKGKTNIFFCEPYKDILRVRPIQEKIVIQNFTFLWETVESFGKYLDINFYKMDERIQTYFEELDYFKAQYTSPFTDLSKDQVFFNNYFSRIDHKYNEHLQHAKIHVSKKKEMYRRFSFLINIEDVMDKVQKNHPTFSYSRILGDTNFSYLESELYYAGKEVECSFKKEEEVYILQAGAKQYRNEALEQAIEDFLMDTKKEMRIPNLYKPVVRYLEWMTHIGNRFSEDQVLQIHESLKSCYDADEIEEKAATSIRTTQTDFLPFKTNHFESDKKSIHIRIYHIFEKEIMHVVRCDQETSKKTEKFHVGSREEMKKIYNDLLRPEIEDMMNENF